MFLTHYCFFSIGTSNGYLTCIEIIFGTCLIISFITHFFIKLNVLLKSFVNQLFCLLAHIVVILICGLYADAEFSFPAIPIVVCVVFYYAFTVLGNFIVHTIYNAYGKAKDMSAKSHYVCGYYINSFRANESLKLFINQNDIQYGYMIGFSIKPRTYTDDNQLKEIYKNYGYVIHDFFGKYKSIFFVTKSNHFFCFIKTDFNDIKNLRIQHVIPNQANHSTNLLAKFELFKERINNDTIQVNGMTTIYGMNSSNTNELINICESMINSSDLEENASIICLYNPSSTHLQINDLYKYAILKHFIDDSKINIDFLSFKIDTDVMYVPTYAYFSQLVYDYNSLISLMPEHLKQIAIRHFSAIAIQHFSSNQSINKNLLLIKYPVEKIAHSRFSIQEITNKIYTFYLNPSQIIFNINLDYVKLENIQCLQNNINRLKKYGYKISVSNITAENIEIARNIKPYLSFYKHIESSDNTKTKTYNHLMQRLLNKYNLKFLN
jgi:hypothetical protein